jgi:pimeloyl-ACP methyl ester carboxylesterase
VFFLHGTPGSRLSARPSEEDLARLGVHLITYDRPGYGRSDPQPGRSVADAADDVRAIADAFAIGRFAVIGRSGGGPHALACAALLQDRVTRVASLVGLAPYDAIGLDWWQGMVPLNREQYGAALQGPRQLASVIYPQVVAMRANPEHLANRLEAEGPPEDRAALSDPEYRATFIESITEAVGRSLDGWAADSLAFTRPWGFEPQWISSPTLLWHGTRDVFIPVTHAHWLADRIKGALLLLSEHGTHLSASSVQRGAIRWLLDGGMPNLAAG